MVDNGSVVERRANEFRFGHISEPKGHPGREQRGVAVGEIVKHGHPPAFGMQAANQMAPDEAAPTGYDDDPIAHRRFTHAFSKCPALIRCRLSRP